MKLPRWLVIGMLTSSVLAVLAAGWLWVTWPERAAQEFVDHMATGRYEEAKEMVELECEHGSYVVEFTILSREWTLKKWRWLNLEPKPRTVVDVLCARQWYRIAGEPVDWEFQAAGRKIFHPMPHGFPPLHFSESEATSLP